VVISPLWQQRKRRLSVPPLGSVALVLALGWFGCDAVVMVARYECPDCGASVITSLPELLGSDHRVWAFIEIVEALDLSVLYERRPAVGGKGRPGYDPTMMLTLLLFGLLDAKRSSRELEAACRQDLRYMAICGWRIRPDHATIARFRRSVDDVAGDVFIEVLSECDRRGMIDLERLALDGTKIEAAASKESNHTVEHLQQLHDKVQQMLHEAEAADSDIDSDISHTGTSDGDGSDKDGGGWWGVRRGRETMRKLERVEQTQEAQRQAQQRRDADVKAKGRKRNSKATGNVVDPDSRLQPGNGGGWIQGFNGQAVVDANQIIVATQVTPETTDVHMFQPMVIETLANLAAAGIDAPVGIIIADGGYASKDNFGFESEIEANVLIATKKKHRIGGFTPIDWDQSSDKTKAWFAMECRVVFNQELYAQRAPLIEGTFALAKCRRLFRRFQCRGLDAVNAEWTWQGVVHNIDKILRHQQNGSPNPTPPRSSRNCHRHHRRHRKQRYQPINHHH